LVRDRATRERFPADAGLKRAAQESMDRHGLLGRGGDIFFLAPPLCVNRDEIDHLIARVDAVIADLAHRFGSVR
jgi:adenosylmethionine-8-amino-7-oxononanoate aminotransferase